ncbi:FlgO family outer membrane protein [Celerinatantimonas diazotrophica]|uniref:TolB-like protein n=1 Tax=Celerinatantimonas diazotrophica TaxID=412034 RepID=A0A4R1JMJ3_9GAMM|nr:FlgO family outer membrane protein [Celerinatantimonas diazotrophica]TCK52180.1 TolB-like protein [Celerinatantimonas diazotrophica]CAG9296115.1 hypothetical protein CEDIAZO_01258 [Celerinatantimonas diazotrophica]
MKAIVVGVLMSITLTGCAQLGFGQSEQPSAEPSTPKSAYSYTDEQPPKEEKKGFWARLFSPSSDKPAPQPKPSVMEKPVNDNPQNLTLEDYVADMANQMMRSAKYVNPHTPIGVASFVSLEDLRKTSPFGMQLSESFVFEMQQHGLSLIDYKATGFIRITHNGDFVYSRNTSELPKVQPIEYLLIGTYNRTSRGYIVNARLVGARSKVVVASAQQLIPLSVYDSAMDIDPNRNKPMMKDGVVLIQSSNSK